MGGGVWEIWQVVKTQVAYWVTLKKFFNKKMYYVWKFELHPNSRILLAFKKQKIIFTTFFLRMMQLVVSNSLLKEYIHLEDRISSKGQLFQSIPHFWRILYGLPRNWRFFFITDAKGAQEFVY